MNTRIENFLNMVVRVRGHLKLGDEIMTAVNRYTDANASLEGHFTEAETTGMLQQSNNTGKAILKKQRRYELVDSLLKVIKILVAYATFENNPELLGQVKMSKSNLIKMAVNSLKGFAQEILTTAETLMAELNAYGMTAALTVGLKAALDDFVLVMQTPQMSKSTKKQLTSQLKMICKELETDLNKMDALVDLVQEKEPVYHAEYFNMRRIEGNGTSKVALTAKAVDAIEGTGLKSVLFTFALNGNEEKKAGTDMMKSVKRTGKKGGFILKTLPEGTYVCTVEYEGYVAQTFNVYVNTGVLTRVNVELQRAA